jgi:hypothetical protein
MSKGFCFVLGAIAGSLFVLLLWLIVWGATRESSEERIQREARENVLRKMAEDTFKREWDLQFEGPPKRAVIADPPLPPPMPPD